MSDPYVPPTPPPPPPGSAPPPPPYTGGPGPGTGGVSQNRSLMIVLSYLWILFLVPLLVEKDDREVQWHAKHGLVLTVAEVILWIVVVVLSSTLLAVLPDFGCTGCFLYTGVWIVTLVVRIMAIMKGVNGQRFLIPGLSDFVNRF